MIGTTTPSDKLSVVSGNILISSGYLIGHTPSTQTFTYDTKTMGAYALGWMADSWNGAGSTAWLSGYGGIKFFTGNAPSLSITGGGNVGIGTTTPTGRLHVVGGTAAASTDGAPITLTGQNAGTGANNNGGTVVLKGGVKNGTGLDGYVQAETVYFFKNEINGWNGGSLVINARRMVDQNSSTIAIPNTVINPNDGGVGIGTTAPTTKLHVRTGAGASMTDILTLTGTGNAGSDRGIAVLFQVPAGSGVGADGGRIGVAEHSGSTNTYMNFSTTTSSVLTEKMRITSAGSVGIGTTSPGATLDVTGDVRATGTIASWSDARVKKNVRPLDDALGKILKLDGVSFEWRTDEFPDKKFKTGPDIGVIAQNVETQFPEAVETDQKGFKSVAYQKLVAPLIEAVKTLFARDREREAQLQTHEREIASLKARNEALESRAGQAERELQATKARLDEIERLLKTAQEPRP